jgi:hypothetical protein
MRGPVGLFAPPTGDTAFVDLAVPHEESELIVHLDPKFLAPPYLKGNRLLFNVEGHGRFWLHVAGEHESTAGRPRATSAPAGQGE